MPITAAEPPIETSPLVDKPADTVAEPPSKPDPADSDKAPPSDRPEPADRDTLPATPDELSPELINTEPEEPCAIEDLI
jgi:hypothetical protein